LQLFSRVDLNLPIYFVEDHQTEAARFEKPVFSVSYQSFFSIPTGSSITTASCLTMAETQRKWGKADDTKLAELFRSGPRGGGVSSTDLVAKNIHAVIQAHFPSREYKNFAPLFRSKARAWNIDQALAGQRSKFMLYSFANTIFSIH
jgi:hypothetical protein